MLCALMHSGCVLDRQVRAPRFKPRPRQIDNSVPCAPYIAYRYYAPVNKLVSLTWLLWALRSFRSFTLHCLTLRLWDHKSVDTIGSPKTGTHLELSERVQIQCTSVVRKSHERNTMTQDKKEDRKHQTWKRSR